MLGIKAWVFVCKASTTAELYIRVCLFSQGAAPAESKYKVEEII